MKSFFFKEMLKHLFFFTSVFAKKKSVGSDHKPVLEFPSEASF